MPFVSNEDVVEWFRANLDANKASFGTGIGFVYDYEQAKIRYPSIVIIPDPLRRRREGTAYWTLIFTINVFIFHRELTKTRSLRSKDDLAAARDVTEYLHDHSKLDTAGTPNIELPGYVVEEEGGRIGRFIEGHRPESSVGTRLVWQGATRERYARIGG